MLYLYIMMATMLCTGTLSTITAKFMNEEVSHGYHFHHPYFQAASMFIGESFCLLAYTIYLRFDRSIQTSFDVGTIVTKSDRVISKLGSFVYMFLEVLCRGTGRESLRTDPADRNRPRIRIRGSLRCMPHR